MKDLIAPLSTLSLLLLAACSDPAANVPSAQVSTNNTEAASTRANSPSTQNAGSIYTIDTASSRIDWIGSKVTGSHDGGFKHFQGQFTVVDGKIADTGNEITIDTTSLWSDTDRLTGHLRSADFFDVEKYPTATFVSTSVNQAGTNATVQGDLTMHGVTKNISFPAQIQVSEDTVHVKAEFSINRFDFHMKYKGKADDLIRPNVVIKLDVKATPNMALLR